MSRDFVGALLQLNAEKGVSREQLVRTVEEAIQSAYRRVAGDEDIQVRIDGETGKVRVYRARLVVEEVEDSATQMTLEDARTHQADAEVGDTVETEQLDQDWEGARLSGPARGGGGRGLRHANDARGCSDSSG